DGVNTIKITVERGIVAKSEVGGSQISDEIDLNPYCETNHCHCEPDPWIASPYQQETGYAGQHEDGNHQAGRENSIEKPSHRDPPDTPCDAHYRLVKAKFGRRDTPLGETGHEVNDDTGG